MSILHADPPPNEDWGKTPKACAILNMGQSRLYEILPNLPNEDPEGIIRTFVLKSPGSQRGTRLFELNSLRRWLDWKYKQSQAKRQKEIL
jgi:hypothetical protein